MIPLGMRVRVRSFEEVGGIVPLGTRVRVRSFNSHGAILSDH